MTKANFKRQIEQKLVFNGVDEALAKELLTSFWLRMMFMVRCGFIEKPVFSSQLVHNVFLFLLKEPDKKEQVLFIKNMKWYHFFEKILHIFLYRKSRRIKE